MTTALQLHSEHTQAQPQPQMPVRERRRGQRHSLSVYRLVRITSDNDEGFARVRNISDGGMKLELTMPLAAGDGIDVAFSDTIMLGARVAWVEGAECGVAFDRPIDSEALLSSLAGGPQTLQLSTNLPATVEFNGYRRRTQVQQVSLRNVRITRDSSFHPGLHVRLILQGGRETDAVVRWTEDDYADIYLLEPFAIADLGSIKSF